MKTHDQAMERKTESLVKLKDCMERSNIAILTDYRGAAKGLTVKQVTDLRNKLRKHNAEYIIVKNTLMKRAAKDLGYEGLDEHLEGPTGVVFGYGDPAVVTKTVLDFCADNKPTLLPNVKAGHLEGQVLKSEQLKAIASLPSREQILTQLLGLMIAPHRQLLGMLNAPGRAVATVVDAWTKKRQEEGETLPSAAPAEEATPAEEAAPAAEATPQAEAASDSEAAPAAEAPAASE
jgi:large subunit ribosomal protein L10